MKETLRLHCDANRCGRVFGAARRTRAWASLLAAWGVFCLVAGGNQTTQFGAIRDVFEVDGAKAFVIHPTASAADSSKPWVWYAPTFIDRHPDDSHAWMAKQLLAAGYYIVGVEVGESYGSPAGREIYSRFYQYVREKYGLDSTACLLAQSRGGLMLLNWAAENPEKVARIAGIYPVCNVESYPGVEKAAPAYEMTSVELSQYLSDHNPIERTERLANAKVPVLFVHGDSDTVVPLEKNSAEYVRRYRAAGGDARVIVTPGKGHEVCAEFFQSGALVEFLLERGSGG